MGNFYFNEKEERVLAGADTKAFIDESWDFGMRMLSKYGLKDFDGLMGMDPETYGDLKEMYERAKQIKDLAHRTSDQMDQQTRILFYLVEQNNNLLEKIEELSEEIDSLKSSKALKKLD